MKKIDYSSFYSTPEKYVTIQIHKWKSRSFIVKSIYTIFNCSIFFAFTFQEDNTVFVFLLYGMFRKCGEISYMTGCYFLFLLVSHMLWKIPYLKEIKYVSLFVLQFSHLRTNLSMWELQSKCRNSRFEKNENWLRIQGIMVIVMIISEILRTISVILKLMYFTNKKKKKEGNRHYDTSRLKE